MAPNAPSGEPFSMFFHGLRLDMGRFFVYTKKAVFIEVNIAYLGISVTADAIIM